MRTVRSKMHKRAVACNIAADNFAKSTEFGTDGGLIPFEVAEPHRTVEARRSRWNLFVLQHRRADGGSIKVAHHFESAAKCFILLPLALHSSLCS